MACRPLPRATLPRLKKLPLGAEKKFKIQMAKGKWQMENHLTFVLYHLICSSARVAFAVMSCGPATRVGQALPLQDYLEADGQVKWSAAADKGQI